VAHDHQSAGDTHKVTIETFDRDAPGGRENIDGVEVQPSDLSQMTV
jgi:hypothetical protein